MDKVYKEHLIGQEVQIYPGDTDYKFGLIRDIDDNGVLFEITRSKDRNFRPGKLMFISFSARLTFEEI